MKNESNINARNSLGKGEVVSSILTGSTTKPNDSTASRGGVIALATFRDATKREHDIPSRGKSVDYGPGSFMEDMMKDLTDVRRKYKAWRKSAEGLLTDEARIQAERVEMHLSSLSRCRFASAAARHMALDDVLKLEAMVGY